MRLILHDLAPDEFGRAFPNLPAQTQVIGPGPVRCCQGCFGCWVATPGECVLHDGFEATGRRMGACGNLILVSRIVYGGLSPFVKAVLDRSIGYMLPFFTLRNGQMHHVSRYPGRARLTGIGYGPATQGEKDTFRRLMDANGLNYNALQCRTLFAERPEELYQLKEVFA